MAGSEEEIRRLAALGVHMEHVLTAISDLKTQLDKLVTRAELKSVFDRLETLEKRIEEQAPLSLWRKATAIAAGVAAIGAAGALIYKVMERF